MPRNRDASPVPRSNRDVSQEVSADGGSMAGTLDVVQQQRLERRRATNRAYQRRYQPSKPGKATERKYEGSDRGKQTRSDYQRSKPGREASARYRGTEQGQIMEEKRSEIKRHDRQAEKYQQKDLSGKNLGMRVGRLSSEQLAVRAQENEQVEQGVLWLEEGRYRSVGEERASLQLVGEQGVPEHLREQYQRQLSEIDASPEASSGEYE